VQITLYITTSNNGYAGYDATWQMAFAAGDELGNHTVNHCRPDLSGCAKPYGAASKSLGTAGAEIDQATDYIAAKLGTRGVWTMAYPYGDTGYKSLARERFFLARGVGGGTVGPGDNTDPYNLPCFVAKGGESPGAFNALVDSARAQGKWLTFLFHTLLPDAQNWFAGVDIGSVTGSMSYAKALPDVWLGTLVDVGAYWLGQKTLQAVVSGPVSARTTWTWSLPAHFPPGKFLRVTVGGGSLEQGTRTLPWDGHGYYEVALDASSLTWTP